VLRRAPLAVAGRDVLELGCGTGKNTGWLAEHARTVVGLDFSAGMLARARERVRAANVRFARHDVRQRWPVPDAAAAPWPASTAIAAPRPWALRLLGEIASNREGPDVAAAETHYRAAMALASELGMRPLVAHCQLGLGRLHRRAGDRAQAEQHVATASAMYGAMGMTSWLERAEAALGAVPRRHG
jgi:SAM-dependent methyltransferase